jgi:hypothetical protein
MLWSLLFASDAQSRERETHTTIKSSWAMTLWLGRSRHQSFRPVKKSKSCRRLKHVATPYRTGPVCGRLSQGDLMVSKPLFVEILACR